MTGTAHADSHGQKALTDVIDTMPGDWLRRVLGTLRDMLLPRGCAGCGVPDEVLCARCARQFAGCHARASAVGRSGASYACAVYEGAVRAAILQWKDHGDAEAGRPLADALAELAVRCEAAGAWDAADMRSTFMRSASLRPVLVIPAPSSSRSIRRRGGLHTMPLATAVANRLSSVGVAAAARPLLAVSGRTRKSVQTADATARAARLHGHIRIVDPAGVAGTRALLVDDIVTTGATLRHCARALEDCGATVLGALALAHTPPPVRSQRA